MWKKFPSKIQATGMKSLFIEFCRDYGVDKKEYEIEVKQAEATEGKKVVKTYTYNKAGG